MSGAWRAWCFAFATQAVACADHGSLVVKVSSPLTVPAETDFMMVQILEGTQPITDQSDELAMSLHPGWPQLVPIVASASSPRTITVVVELWKTSSSGGTRQLVGRGSVDATFPNRGEADVPIEVERACSGSNGFGVGPGCKGPSKSDGGVSEAGTCGPTLETCSSHQLCLDNFCRFTCTKDQDCTKVPGSHCDMGGLCDCGPTSPCFEDHSCYPFMCIHGCCGS